MFFTDAQVRSYMATKIHEIGQKLSGQRGTEADLDAIFLQVAQRELPDLYPSPAAAPAAAPSPGPATVPGAPAPAVSPAPAGTP